MICTCQSVREVVCNLGLSSLVNQGHHAFLDTELLEIVVRY